VAKTRQSFLVAMVSPRHRWQVISRARSTIAVLREGAPQAPVPQWLMKEALATPRCPDLFELSISARKNEDGLPVRHSAGTVNCAHGLEELRPPERQCLPQFPTHAGAAGARVHCLSRGGDWPDSSRTTAIGAPQV
jgi:hypothetical protein